MINTSIHNSRDIINIAEDNVELNSQNASCILSKSPAQPAVVVEVSWLCFPWQVLRGCQHDIYHQVAGVLWCRGRVTSLLYAASWWVPLPTWLWLGRGFQPGIHRKPEKVSSSAVWLTWLKPFHSLAEHKQAMLPFHQTHAWSSSSFFSSF